jgi:hypothetical protein
MMRMITILLLLMSAPAFSGDPGEVPPSLVITVTANHLYLCGEGHGGIYGCIDEARSREIGAITIVASDESIAADEAMASAVQELLNAVHTAGFEVELSYRNDETGT